MERRGGLTDQDIRTSVSVALPSVRTTRYSRPRQRVELCRMQTYHVAGVGVHDVVVFVSSCRPMTSPARTAINWCVISDSSWNRSSVGRKNV